ncbi:MAG: hypothetical protein IJD42_04400 [Clostridia bacterium]|nr:hypothetical protein [Clostridia bacterium]
MYGSIRKSYGAKRASRETETTERKVSFFAKRKKKKTAKPGEYEETSYINVEAPTQETRATRANTTPTQEKTNKNQVIKNEFPIASVILTIVFTMMVMVLAFGLGG